MPAACHAWTLMAACVIVAGCATSDSMPPSDSACAAYAGIPLTHRDQAHSVRVVAAHGKNSIDRLDWASLARESQTLAFYMAVARLRDVQSNLQAHGQPSCTPVGIVEIGARPDQRVLTERLDRLHDLAVRHSVASPAMLLVGGAVRLAATLGWWGAPPSALADAPGTTVAAAS